MSLENVVESFSEVELEALWYWLDYEEINANDLNENLDDAGIEFVKSAFIDGFLKAREESK